MNYRKALSATVVSSLLLLNCTVCASAVELKAPTQTTSDHFYTLKDTDFERAEIVGESKQTEATLQNGVDVTAIDTLISEGKSDTTEIENHTVSMVYSIDLNKVTSENLTTYAYNGSGSTSRSGTDSSISVKCTSKLSYSYITNNQKVYIKLNKASGKLVACNGSKTPNVGSGVAITANHITVGEYGPNTSGICVNHSWKKTGKNYASSWSYSPSWEAVGSDQNVSKVGSSQSIKLERGNSHWYFTFQNYAPLGQGE